VHPLETYESTWLRREHMSKDASQTGKQVISQSKVMVKATTHFSNIHTYLYRKSPYKKTYTYNIRVNKLAEIQ